MNLTFDGNFFYVFVVGGVLTSSLLTVWLEESDSTRPEISKKNFPSCRKTTGLALPDLEVIYSSGLLKLCKMISYHQALFLQACKRFLSQFCA